MPELIPYELSRDANFLPDGLVIPTSQYINAYVLTAGTVQGVSIPNGARVAIFNSTGNFYLNWLTTAAVPATNITDGSGPELNPVARDVSDYSSYSLIAPADCVVTVAYFL
jgi:hypothetical protein